MFEWNGMEDAHPLTPTNIQIGKQIKNNKFVKLTNGVTVSLTNKQISRQEDNLSFKTNK